MRLGVLGPAIDHEADLDAAAHFLLHEVGADRAVYLGIDGMLDRVVRRWAEQLVGAAPDDAALWSRAAERCLTADATQIDRFLEAERERRSLKIFESLPGDDTRAIEILNGRVAVMIYDKARLDEEDIAAASLLVFGKSNAPLVEQIGSRWFLSPGPFSGGGVLVLEDRDEGIHLTLFDARGREQARERLTAERPAKPELADQS
jgi:hypothetical protein